MGSSTRFVGSFIMCSIHLIWEKIPFVKVLERGKVVEAKFKDRNVWWSLSSTSARFQIRRSPGECTSIQIYRRRRAHTRSTRAFLKSERCIIKLAPPLFPCSQEIPWTKKRGFREVSFSINFSTILHYKFLIYRRFIHSKSEK